MSTGVPKRLWILLAICSASLAAAAQTVRKPAPATPQTKRAARATVSPVDKAEEALGRGDYAAAAALLRPAVQADPSDYRAWYDLGYVENALGHLPEAATAYRKSIALKADVFESNLNLGLVLAKQGNNQAESFLRAATRLKPAGDANAGIARAWLALGRLLADNKPGEALAAFREVARLDPKNVEPHLAVAILLEKQKDYAGAEQEFKQAAVLDPKSSEALAGLVNVYMETRRLPEAEAALRHYLEVDPRNNTARLQLGRVLAAQGRAQDAVPELEAALAQQRDPAALRELAGLHAAAGQYEKAVAEYRELLGSAPNDADLHYALGTALMNQKNFEAAQQELLGAVRLKPSLADAYGNLAVVAMETKSYPLAIQAVNARAKLLSETPATYFLRATAYDHLRDYQQAAENYRQFLQVSGGKNPDQEWQARHRLVAIDPRGKK